MHTENRGRGGIAWGALSSLLLAVGCSSQASLPADPVRPVKTIVVVAGGEPRVRSFPGKVEALRKVELAFRVSGRLNQLPVKEGERLSEGDLIAQLRLDEFQARLKTLQGQLDQARAALRALLSGERPEQRLRLEAQVRAAQAKLANARTEFDRASRLIQSRAISRSDYDRSLTDYQVAQEELEAARQALEQGMIAREEDVEAQEAVVRGLEGQVVEANIQLKDATLHAPYDGVIAQRFVELNQNVTANEPIVKFQDVDEIAVTVDVPETFMAADLNTADVAQLVAEFSGAPGVRFPVQIREVAQRADPTTQTFRIRAVMKAPPDVNLLPGMTATVSITYQRARILGERILVPISAVSQVSSGEQAAWVVGENQAVSLRPVQLGEATGGQIEIVDGLQPGERIAVAGVRALREGMKVRDLGEALGGGPL